MPAFFYILRCADGTFYVGHTIDLQARLAVGHSTPAVTGICPPAI